MSYTSDLVATKISNELKEKILDLSWRKIATQTLYVSANGNDDTADGSQSKPFASVSSAIAYLRQNFKHTANAVITIKFLTDYTFTGNLFIFDVVGMDINSRLVIDGSDHTVTFKTRLYIASASIELRNLNFESLKASQDGVIFAADYAQLFLGGTINVTLRHSGCTVLSIARHSRFSNNGAALTVSADAGITGRALFRYRDFSSIHVFGTSSASVTVDGVEFTLAVFDGYRFSYANCDQQIQGTATGKKYQLDSTTALSTNGHGNDYLIGSTDGTLNAEAGCWVS